eukprot:m.85182 g.85182  ORF g.85182 m.85182 type:complete len:684 (+) comp8376_c0_seq2:129-2180(+)
MEYLDVVSGALQPVGRPQRTARFERLLLLVAVLSGVAVVLAGAALAIVLSDAQCDCATAAEKAVAASSALTSIGHEWNGTQLRLRRDDGSWGPYVDLAGPAGQNAPNNTGLGLSVVHYGAVGDGSTDDTLAIQACIDDAAARGDDVLLPAGTYLTTTSLQVPAGVAIRGAGIGRNPLASDLTGSVILYCGSDWAVKLQGHAAGLHDLVLYDWNGPACGNAAGGLLLDAANRGLESVRVSNVLVYLFTDGTAVKLHASGPDGAIPYASFYDLRIRHAKTGLHLLAETSTSFVNSNSFVGGAISGAISEYGIRVEGPGANNNNVFLSVVVEPPSSLHGHLNVAGFKSNVCFIGSRFEGTALDHSEPIIVISPESTGNILTSTLVGHSFASVDYDLNPRFDFQSNKAVAFQSSRANAIVNPSLQPDLPSSSPKHWTLTGTGASMTVAVGETPLRAHAEILEITVPSGTSAILLPDLLHQGTELGWAQFGVYVRHNASASVFCTVFGSGGTQSSSPYDTASEGSWQFLGSLARKSDQPLAPKLVIDNSAQSAPAIVSVTLPVVAFTAAQLEVGENPLLQSGGLLSGPLALGTATLASAAGSASWVLPRTANTFVLQSAGTIQRINYLQDRFLPGTIITLLFDAPGFVVQHSVFIALVGAQNFAPAQGGSLSLLALSAGTWREVARNT